MFYHFIRSIKLSAFHSCILLKPICELQYLGKLKTKYIAVFLKCYQNVTFFLSSPSHGIPRGSFQSWSFLTIHRDHPDFYIVSSCLGITPSRRSLCPERCLWQGDEAFDFCTSRRPSGVRPRTRWISFMVNPETVPPSDMVFSF